MRRILDLLRNSLNVELVELEAPVAAEMLDVSVTDTSPVKTTQSAPKNVGLRLK